MSGGSGGDAHRQRGGISARDVAGERGQLRRVAVAEDVVRREADAVEIRQAAAVARGGAVDRRADGGREGDLRGLDLVGVRGRGTGIAVDLEVHVGHAAVVAAREDRREGDRAVAAGALHAAQVVLVDDAGAVEGVAALAVAVPQVDRVTRQVGATAVRVHQLQREGQRHAAGGAARGPDAGADVAAHDAAQGQHVGDPAAVAVGAVAGVGAGGLLGDHRAAAGGPRGPCRTGGSR